MALKMILRNISLFNSNQSLKKAITDRKFFLRNFRTLAKEGGTSTLSVCDLFMMYPEN
jgi:hypothetical protein